MIRATRTQWIKFAVVLALYLIFLVWLRSWLGLVVVPFIFDAYITKKIPWTWWRESKNRHVVTVMGWVDAIVFALVAVYFVNLYFFQNYVIPSSSLEKSLLTGDYLFVSKMSYGPQIQLICPEAVRTNYKELLETDSYPPCYRIIPSLPPFTAHSWMTALQMERFEQKATLLNERLKRCQGNWEDAFFITLARNFGFGLNGDAFETWAHRLPFRAVDKHRNDLFQIEAIFFGQAGILEDSDGDGYYLRLKKEYTYLQHKFGLIPMDASLWRFLRLRPANFPHIRIAQLACLYHRAYGLLSRIMETETLQGVRDILKGGTSEYWLTHYTFGGSSPSRPKTLSNTSLDLLIINTVVTFLYAYGLHKGNRVLCARAGSFLEELKAENNYITRMWEQCGMKASNAADSQALIQLKKEYCDKKKCLYCRIGYEYLKRS
jgi:hypothetical protein